MTWLGVFWIGHGAVVGAVSREKEKFSGRVRSCAACLASSLFGHGALAGAVLHQRKTLAGLRWCFARLCAHSWGPALSCPRPVEAPLGAGPLAQQCAVASGLRRRGVWARALDR